MSEEKLNSNQKLLPQRLMSFRGSRDLSLGSLNASRGCVGFPNNRDNARKHFAPNVNVQRKKNQEVRVKDEFVKEERKSGRGSRGRGQGRGRHSNNLVQASGSVFAEGIAVSTVANARRSTGYKYDSGNSKDEVLEIPKLNLRQNCKVDKEEEDRKLKELMRDNFVENADLEPDVLFAPISLPLNLKNTNVGKDVKLKAEPEIKKEKVEIVHGVKIKQEVIENEDENLNSSAALSSVPECRIKEEPVDSEKGPHDSLFQSLNVKEKKLFLIQLPDRLPALSVGSSETERERLSNSKAKPSQVVHNPENEGVKNYCQLSDLAPGHIGHLQVRRSGKVELVLGKCVLNVTLGTSVGFQQDLVAIQLHCNDQHTGESVNLGPVTSRLICTPDWNSLLKGTVNF